MERKHIALRATLAAAGSHTDRIDAGIAALRTAEHPRVQGATELRQWLASELVRITCVRAERAARRPKTRKPLRDRLLARVRREVRASYEACQYRRSESKWAGGDHTVDVVVVQQPTAGGARGDSQRVWSSNGKWCGTNSSHDITVSWDWIRKVGARGLGCVDGMLTLSARPCDGLRTGETAYVCRWVQQGRGVSLTAVDGVIYRAGNEWMHAQTLQGARRAAAGRIAAAEAERARAAQALQSAEAEIAAVRGLVVRRADIPPSVACVTGIADWIAKRGLPADTETIDAADLLRMAIASGDRVNFVRRIVAHLSHRVAA